MGTMAGSLGESDLFNLKLKGRQNPSRGLVRNSERRTLRVLLPVNLGHRACWDSVIEGLRSLLRNPEVLDELSEDLAQSLVGVSCSSSHYILTHCMCESARGFGAARA